MSKKGIGTFLAGAAIGAGLGILFAPKKGSETRAELKEAITDLVDKAKNLEKEDVKLYIETKTEEIKKAISELDKEKVMDYAKDKAKAINAKAEELVKYVVDKGTPVMKETANNIRVKTASVTRDILNKLEKTEEVKGEEA